MTGGSGITVVTPTIPPRAALLDRAVTSIHAQTLPAERIIIETDPAGDGAPATRQRGLEQVTTEWVAFLDDDDEMLPQHLQTLTACAREHNADYVYSYFEIIGPDGTPFGEYDPVLGTFGKPFDPVRPTTTTITTLVRTSLAQQVGFLNPDQPAGSTRRACEDDYFTRGCVTAGARIVHTPHRTWLWHHDSANTSGRPWNRPGDWRW